MQTSKENVDPNQSVKQSTLQVKSIPAPEVGVLMAQTNQNNPQFNQESNPTMTNTSPQKWFLMPTTIEGWDKYSNFVYLYDT